MDLVRHLSNPVGPLKALLEGPPSIPNDSKRTPIERSTRPAADGVALAALHPHPGRIMGAIVRVLSEHREPMQAKAIHAAVEALLGEPVRWGTVKGALAGNIAGPSPRFVRVARGRYRLR